MSELIVLEVEPEIVAKLKKRADEHCRSIEEEHHQILRDALLGNSAIAPALTFESYLRKMPDVGTDAEFAQIVGSIRDIVLSE
jgi:plasmid stability protein